MIVQKDGETRIQYLMRVLEQYFYDTGAGEYNIDFDDAQCDGLCLYEDIRCELEGLGLLSDEEPTT